MYPEGALSSLDRPFRTCVGCRRSHHQRRLVRFAVTGTAIVVDTGQVLPGRGAYLCWRRECAEQVLGDGRRLVRALRAGSDNVTVDTGALLQDWEANRTAHAPGMAIQTK
jgi:predicted RNA-binding protein YlxR (DUF448 family)